jgi:hypothetical protein
MLESGRLFLRNPWFLHSRDLPGSSLLEQAREAIVPDGAPKL